MPEKAVATGTVIKIDETQGGTFSDYLLVENFTIPPRTRAEIDAIALEDTFDVPELGIEERSNFTQNEFWTPGDSQNDTLDTLFDSKAEFDMQVVSTHVAPQTLEWSAKVVGLTPAELTNDGLWMREVTFVRTSAISNTTPP